jgi:hypothetical protein
MHCPEPCTCQCRQSNEIVIGQWLPDGGVGQVDPLSNVAAR